MGIKGFFSFFGSLLSPVNLNSLKNKTIGVDCFIWLHKAVYCGLELATNKNGNKFVNYIINNIKHLRSFGIKLVIIFDGDKVGLKRREIIRRKNQIKNNSDKKSIIKNLDIDYNMIYKVIKILKILNIDYIVAPYEADAELAYLFKIGYIDYVLTEDSDLCAYGVTRVLYKYNRKSNTVQYFDLTRALSKFKNYNQFLEMCIMSGCDFFKINNVGIATAWKLLKKHESFICCPFDKSYRTKFYMAKFLFLNQVVYCPRDRIMKRLNNFNLINIGEIEEMYYKNFMSDPEITALFGFIKNGAIAMLISKGMVPPDSY